MMMQARERLGPVPMTGTRSVWTVVAKGYPLLTRHGSGQMTEGGGLPVQDRRDNYRIVQGARGVAAAVMVLDWHPVQGFRCSRSRMRIGQRAALIGETIMPASLPDSLWLSLSIGDSGCILPFGSPRRSRTPCCNSTCVRAGI